MNDINIFKNRLRSLRKENHMTQQELADKIGIVRTAITNYEAGRNIPDSETLSIIASIYDTTTDYLLGNSNIRNPYNTNIKEDDTPTLPDEFATPEEAIKFLLEQTVIMGFGGFDIDKLSDDEKIEFANELLGQLKMLSYKYKK